ncbi:hypothetical protein CAEBREN_03239 [Caenorhabditis brenneri]|uniref:F-box domain-containing protein n=1 Tax=Caenorhabditis brenneri TaxID=135651 RepID=G0MFB0_CAEBE|nr:hypothetical protein CAEBREN_03239 [Caenorhabditis brenneri]
MKFLKFAFLIQMNIIKQMDYHEMFLLSLCSRRTQNLMKYLRLRALKVQYWMVKERTKVVISQQDTTDQLYMAHLKDIPLSSMHREVRSVNIGGSKVLCRVKRRKRDSGDVFHNLIHDGNLFNLITSLQNHIQPFFHPTVDVELQIQIEEAEIEFPVLQGVTRSYLYGTAIHTSFLDAFYTVYPDQHSSKIDCRIKGLFKPNSKLFQIDQLLLRFSECSAAKVLEHFNGSYLFLYRADVDAVDLTNFLRRWKSENAYPNLKLLVVKKKRFMQNSILEEFETKPWDLSNRPETYAYQSKVVRSPGSINCVHAHEIVRDNDAMVASVDARVFSFIFCVWSEEQLKMKSNL